MVEVLLYSGIYLIELLYMFIILFLLMFLFYKFLNNIFKLFIGYVIIRCS